MASTSPARCGASTGARRAEKKFQGFMPSNPLISLDSDERIQGNPTFATRGLRSQKATEQENQNGLSGADGRQRESVLALSVRERLGEKKAALAQALGIDAMPDPKREMPLGWNRRARKRLRGDEHRVKRDHRILIAVDEQDGRRRAAGIARRCFAEMLGADQQAGKAKNRRRRARTSEADMQSHHAALAEADQRE